MSETRHEAHAASTYAAFLDDIIRARPMSRELAQRAALSVLWTLEQRLVADEARDLEAQLPSRLRELLQAMPRGDWGPLRFGLVELLERVADDLGCSLSQADRFVRAVFQAVQRKITPGEAEDVASELPPDLALLWRHPE